MSATPQCWLAEPLPRDVQQAIDSLSRHADVCHLAVMPDVHLGRDVCNGLAVATENVIFPQAVGGDIGCGMAAIATDVEARDVSDPQAAAELLWRLARRAPALSPSTGTQASRVARAAPPCAVECRFAGKAQASRRFASARNARTRQPFSGTAGRPAATRVAHGPQRIASRWASHHVASPGPGAEGRRAGLVRCRLGMWAELPSGRRLGGCLRGRKPDGADPGSRRSVERSLGRTLGGGDFDSYRPQPRPSRGPRGASGVGASQRRPAARRRTGGRGPRFDGLSEFSRHGTWMRACAPERSTRGRATMESPRGATPKYASGRASTTARRILQPASGRCVVGGGACRLQGSRFGDPRSARAAAG